MILGLDISTSITGATLIDTNGNVVVMESIDTRKYKNFFEKAEKVKSFLTNLSKEHKVEEVYIEQSLQSFRSGFSSAKTLSTLSRFNGVVSWMCYSIWSIEPLRENCVVSKFQKGKKQNQLFYNMFLTMNLLSW